MVTNAKIGWRKLSNPYPFVKGYWKNVRNGKYLTVKKISSAGKGKFMSPTIYVVALNYNFNKPLAEYTTQEKAMAYARNYMRRKKQDGIKDKG